MPTVAERILGDGAGGKARRICGGGASAKREGESTGRSAPPSLLQDATQLVGNSLQLRGKMQDSPGVDRHNFNRFAAGDCQSGRMALALSLLKPPQTGGEFAKTGFRFTSRWLNSAHEAALIRRRHRLGSCSSGGRGALMNERFPSQFGFIGRSCTGRSFDGVKTGV